MSFYNKIYNHSPLTIQNCLVSLYGYAWKNRRFGGVFEDELKRAKSRENFSVQQWNQYQQEQLQKLLVHSYLNVPFYQASFDACGFSENKLDKIELDQLNQLPVLAKQQLREFGTTTLISKKREAKGNFFASSGSTGTPTQILFSHAMHQRWSAIFEARIRHWAGVNRFTSRGMIGGRRVLPDANAKPPFYRFNYFEHQVYFSAYHISPANINSYVNGINKYGVEYMTGYAMSNFFLARFIKESGLQVNQQKAVITSSEKLTPEMREIFLDVYGCKTYDSWSGVEACGLVSECEHGSLHISPDSGIIEILDENLQPVPVNTLGNVYCTGLINYDQPLIRYAIGDSMSLSSETCNCKRAMPVIKEIAGRIEDVVIGNDGREMVRFHGIFVGLPNLSQAQVIQHEVGKIIIKIVAVNGSVSPHEKQIIQDRIFSQLGEVELLIEDVSEIPLTANGKFKAVISTVKRNSIIQ
jgi:phenylacetate-CoA ligase